MADDAAKLLSDPHLALIDAGVDCELGEPGGVLFGLAQGDVLRAVSADGGELRAQDVPLTRLSALIELFNERFGLGLGEAERLPIQYMIQKLSDDPTILEQARANERAPFLRALRRHRCSATLASGRRLQDPWHRQLRAPQCRGGRASRASGLLATAVATAPFAEPQYAIEGAVLASGASIQWPRDGLGLIGAAAETEQLARASTPTRASGHRSPAPATCRTGTRFVVRPDDVRITGLGKVVG